MTGSAADSSPPSSRQGAPPLGARRWCAVLVGVAVVHLLLRVVWPVLATDAFHDDYRQNWFWLEQVRAGVDFSATDPLTAYARDFQPPVLAWLYQALAGIADPYHFTKWIGLALFVPFGAGLWSLGERSVPRSVVAPLLVLFGAVDEAWIRELLGGLSRGYGPPLQIATLASVVAGRWWLALAWLALAGLVHPQSLLLGAAVFAIGLARAIRSAADRSRGGARRDLVAPALALCVLVAALAALNVQHAHEMEGRFGTFLTRGEILASVDYQAGGRFRNEHPRSLPIELARTLAVHLGVPDALLVRVPPFAPDARQLPWALGILFVVGAGLDALRRAARARWRDVPWWIPAGLAVAFAWNALAYAFLPRLYFPRRFLVSYVPLGFFAAVAWLIDAWLARLAVAGGARVRAAILGVLALVALASTARFAGGPLAYRIPRGGYEGVARFLGAQPPPTRYAANPRGDADTLIAMVPRRIYIASEIAHPLFRGYLERTVRHRTRLATRALFPEDPERELVALLQDGVQLLVVRRRDLAWETLPAQFAYEPVRSEVTSYWSAERHAAARAYWAEAGARATVYEDETFLVLDLRKLARRG